MRVLLLILLGLSGGVPSGAGLGGGTLLIPMLTVLCGMPQRAAQGVNLVSFAPAAVVALVIHSKNGLVDYRAAWPAAAAAAASGAAAALLAGNMPVALLRRLFGGFITALGLYQIARTFLGISGGKRAGKKENAA